MGVGAVDGRKGFLELPGNADSSIGAGFDAKSRQTPRRLAFREIL
jgi:hypothetical protein